ncbi:MAG TPA: long-chain-fatty-acid--CoA ligase [Desulfatiglandales bacterium]|nr:long-chain-fatty-acid--CoA ligase [Desulfatiglandales bacterium]
MKIGDIIKRASKYYPDKLASVFKDVRLTYKELNDRTNRVGNALLNAGVGKDDRIGILCYNSNVYQEIFFGAAKTGAVTTTINWRLSPREINFVINDAEVKVLFVADNFWGKIESVKDELSTVKIFISIGQKVPGTIYYEDLIKSSDIDEINIDLDPHDTVWQLYTSGTTGRPKGVMLTHRNLEADAEHNIIGNQLNRDNAIHIQVYQMFHIAMKRIVYTAYIFGTTVFLEKFDLKELCELIEKEKCTDLGMAPVMWKAFMDYPDLNKYDLRSLKYASYSTSPMPRALIKRLLEKFPNITFFSTYGLTEAGSSLTILPASDYVLDGPDWKLRRLQSLGRPMMGVDVRIVDEKGEDCPPGNPGEIIGRGENIMKGYWKLTEETQKTIKNGWLYTGDVGYWDEYGYIYLADRKKDMIISGGENIYSREVEEVINELEDVVEVAVIGVPDDIWGEAVKAIIVKSYDSELTEADVINYCAQNIASYKKPKSVDFVSELHRNATGKIMKRLLREKYWKGKERKV